MAQNNKGQCTKQYHKVRWGWQQPWKQKKRTVRKMGWNIMLQTAVRTAAFSLKNLLQVLKTGISQLKEES